MRKSIIMRYQDALKSPNVSFVALIEHYNKPDRVYKYQYFYDEAGNPNRYWKTNITGETFRLNVASSFEDQNDCRPRFDRNTVIDFMKRFLIRVETDNLTDLLKNIDKEITEDFFERIVLNYQNSIFIGCLTAKSSNNHMWKKYANNDTGYCIEYSVPDNELLSHNMLPVIYESKGFDASYAFCLGIILEGVRQGKNRTLEENIQIYSQYYNIWGKLVYVPTFVKGESWHQEEEYRLFLLPHFINSIRMVKAKEEMDKNQCISLEKSVRAIYLGKNFEKNPNSDMLLDEIKTVISGRNISLFQRKADGTKISIC